MDFKEARRLYTDSVRQFEDRAAADAIDDEWDLETATISWCSDGVRDDAIAGLQRRAELRGKRPTLVDLWKLWKHDTPLPGLPPVETL